MGPGYYAVEKAIRDAVLSDSELAGVRAFIEQDLVWAAESAPAVYIYATGREAPENEQRLAGGQRTDWILAISIWCVAWHLDSTERAAELRDLLIERVELALMRDRTIGDKCDRSWLDGGQFISGPGEQGFLSTGEISVKVKLNSTT